MHAFLLVGNNTEDAINSYLSKWKISDWDVVRPSGTGISEIREFSRALSISPSGSHKAGIIPDIDTLTTEAQNALLKTIEEPPPNAYIIGTTTAPEAILPTIISRMDVVRVRGKNTPVDTTILQTLLSSATGQRMKLIEPYIASPADAKNFILMLTHASQQELLTHPSPKLAALIRKLLIAREQLSVNVNPRLVVDNIFA